MKITLPIYEKKEVVNVYEVDSYNILFGTVEDLINVIDLDSIGAGDDFNRVVTKAIPKVFGMIKPLLKDIFDGLTDEEIKNCRLSDVVNVVVWVVKSSISQIDVNGSRKN